jgi:hypothetical protein
VVCYAVWRSVKSTNLPLAIRLSRESEPKHACSLFGQRPLLLTTYYRDLLLRLATGGT